MEHKIRIDKDRIELSGGFAISFQRTLRIPQDGRLYPLPPSLGAFPIHQLRDFAARLPPEWIANPSEPAVFIPMYQREALWLAFEADADRPVAVKVGLGGVDALTGDPWTDGLHADPQDYLVCPQQPWLDGINSGEGEIRQFVAVPLGDGYTIEGQLTGKEDVGGMQIRVVEALPGMIEPRSPKSPGWETPASSLGFSDAAMGMGLGAGGRIVQKIYPDPYGLQVWDQGNTHKLRVWIVNSLQYQQITGKPAPDTPLSATTYTKHGFPWFSFYDEGLGDLPPTTKLAGVKSIREIEADKGINPPDEEGPVEIDPSQIRGIEPEG
jgi:hypothetical protein